MSNLKFLHIETKEHIIILFSLDIFFRGLEILDIGIFDFFAILERLKHQKKICLHEKKIACLMQNAQNYSRKDCPRKDLHVFLSPFSIRRIAFFLILKNVILNKKLHFLVKLCKI